MCVRVCVLVHILYKVSTLQSTLNVMHMRVLLAFCFCLFSSHFNSSLSIHSYYTFSFIRLCMYIYLHSSQFYFSSFSSSTSNSIYKCVKWNYMPELTPLDNYFSIFIQRATIINRSIRLCDSSAREHTDTHTHARKLTWVLVAIYFFFFFNNYS